MEPIRGREYGNWMWTNKEPSGRLQGGEGVELKKKTFSGLETAGVTQPAAGLVQCKTCILTASRHAALCSIPKSGGCLFHLTYQTAPQRSSSLNHKTRALHSYVSWK
jgi:hypothetical protein